MITDPIFYRLFETSPETFFLLLGMPADSAREMAARYQYQAIEFKETREEIKSMLELHDIRESRAYQEAREEGFKAGLQEGLARAIVKMAAKKIPAAEIAVILEIDMQLVHQVLSESEQR